MARDYLYALYNVSRIITQNDDPRQALEAIVDELVDLFDATSASIALVNPDTNRLEIEVFKGLPDHSKEIQLNLGQGVTGWVALHGKPLLIGDVTLDPRYIPVKDTIRTEMAAPMQENGMTIGVINIDSEEVDFWKQEDMDGLLALTSEITASISRLWVIAQLRIKAQQMESLMSVGQSLVSKLELSETLDGITEQGNNIMRSKVCALYLYQSTARELTLQSAAGLQKGMSADESLSVEHSAIGTAVQWKKPIEVLDIRKTEEHHFIDIAQQMDLRSMLCVPIIFEGEVIGTLSAYNDTIHRYSNEEKKLFNALASYAAVAINNARLYGRVFASEEAVRKNERLTTLGLLAAEIAHEIRNPLTVIKLLFDALDLKFPKADMRNEDVRVIKDKLNQLEGIVNRVLNFGKSREKLHTNCVVRSIVADALHLVRLKLRQNRIAVTYQPRDLPLTVNVNQSQIQQVLLNLILNATEAMPNGGKIHITSYGEKRSGLDGAAIEISDTGTGLEPEIKDAIFQSFLTSKPGGTGLGLAIVRRIMESHRGTVEVKETSEKGTTMKLWLPL